MKVHLGSLVLFVVLALASGACKGVAPTEPIKEVDLTLTSYLVARMPEQDVYVEVPGDPGNVRRVTTQDYERYLAAPVFAAQYHVDHDPFQVSSEPLGPHAKGADLGFTLEQWLAANGTGTYTMAKYQAEIALSFQNLVPNGVYSFWYGEITFPPDARIFNRPWRGTGGSHDIFRADDQGNAEFRLVVRPLSESTDDTMAVLAVVYHSDGRTGGPYWGGDYGLSSHVQILTMIPAASDQAWQTVTDSSMARWK